jgi:hypothetical protein
MHVHNVNVASDYAAARVTAKHSQKTSFGAPA